MGLLDVRMRNVARQIVKFEHAEDSNLTNLM